MKKNLAITALVILSFVLQSTLLKTLSFGGISPNLLIILTSVIGFMCGQTSGLLVGFFAGLLYDIFYGDVLCFHGLIMMYIGYLNGIFKQIFYKEDIKLPILLIIGSDFAYNFIYYILMFLLRGRFRIMHYFIQIMVPEMVYTILVTMLIYPPIRNLISYLDQGDQRSDDSFA